MKYKLLLLFNIFLFTGALCAQQPSARHFEVEAKVVDPVKYRVLLSEVVEGILHSYDSAILLILEPLKRCSSSDEVLLRQYIVKQQITLANNQQTIDQWEDMVMDAYLYDYGAERNRRPFLPEFAVRFYKEEEKAVILVNLGGKEVAVAYKGEVLGILPCNIAGISLWKYWVEQYKEEIHFKKYLN